MIVVDTMVMAYLVLPGEHTTDAVRVRQADPEWAAPPLWRSELRHVLATYVRTGQLALSEAIAVMEAAEKVTRGQTWAVRSADVLGLAAASGCSAYDCEYVALAQDLGVPLVTADRRVLRAFPQVAFPISAYPEAPTTPPRTKPSGT